MGIRQLVLGEHSTKNIIIEALAAQWPLSLKQISQEVKKQRGTITYQAVHKALNELLQQNIVEKQGKEYALNKSWIASLKEFSTRLNLSYHLQAKNQKVDMASAQFEFNTMWDLYVMMLDTIESGVLDTTKKRMGSCQFYHFYNWCPLLFSKKEHEQMENIAKQNKNYMVGCHETMMDRWLAEFYRKLGWKVKIGVPCANPTYDTIVHGDTIIQVYFAEPLRNIMDQKFRSMKNVSEADLHALFEDICHRKTKIVVLVNKNAIIAEQIHQQTRSFFKSAERYPEHRLT